MKPWERSKSSGSVTRRARTPASGRKNAYSSACTARAMTRPAARWHREVGIEPPRLRPQPAREHGDHNGELVGGKAIEEKIRHDRVEVAGGRLPVRQCRMHELQSAEIEVIAAGMGQRGRKHRSAGVDADDFRMRKFPRARAQKMARANAHNENPLAARQRIDPRGAAALEPRAGERALHPGVVRREPIETHVDAVERHTQPDTTAPTA